MCNFGQLLGESRIADLAIFDHEKPLKRCPDGRPIATDTGNPFELFFIVREGAAVLPERHQQQHIRADLFSVQVKCVTQEIRHPERHVWRLAHGLKPCAALDRLLSCNGHFLAWGGVDFRSGGACSRVRRRFLF